MTTTSDTSTATPSTPAELVAHHILKLVGEHPAQIGPLRCARIVGGYVTASINENEHDLFTHYAIPQRDWTLRTLKDLIDALEQGGLVFCGSGPRPTLALSRAGHRALDALEHHTQTAAEGSPC